MYADWLVALSRRSGVWHQIDRKQLSEADKFLSNAVSESQLLLGMYPGSLAWIRIENGSISFINHIDASDEKIERFTARGCEIAILYVGDWVSLTRLSDDGVHELSLIKLNGPGASLSATRRSIARFCE